MFDSYWCRIHDYFNLFALPLVCLCSLNYLAFDSSTYYFQYFVFFFYMVFDLIWLMLIPQSVASPLVIIAHHIICMLGWNIPIMYNLKYSKLFAVGVLVEFNTWLLIARRNFKESYILNFLFYITWVLIRVMAFPLLMLAQLIQYYKYTTKAQNEDLAVLIIMMLINCLNAKWSLDLLLKLSISKDKEELIKRKSL